MSESHLTALTLFLPLSLFVLSLTKALHLVRNRKQSDGPPFWLITILVVNSIGGVWSAAILSKLGSGMSLPAQVLKASTSVGLSLYLILIGLLIVPTICRVVKQLTRTVFQCTLTLWRKKS